MRPTWKGTIKLGFVTQPVAIYGAKESKTAIAFNQLHATCKGRINQKTVCVACGGAELAATDLLKGYEHTKGQYVILSKEELEACQIETTKVIDLKEFVPLTELKPFQIAETHYVAPENAGLADAFALIRDALAGVAGIGTLAIGNKERLVALVANGRGLMLHTLRHADEVRDMASIDILDKVPAVTDPKTVGLMRDLMASMMTERLDLEKYPDTYRANVQQVIARKLASQPGDETPAAAPAPKAASVMDALVASLSLVGGKTTLKMELDPPKRAKKAPAA